MKLAKEQIARQFSRAARTYDLAAQLQNEMAEKLIGMIPTKATGRLVDLGCGTGWALKKLAKKKQFELTGIDIAPGMIEAAQARVPSAEFHCCDLEETPLEANVADVVFSNAAIQWCDTGAAIREMYRICKPRGIIVCSTFGPHTLEEIRSAWLSAGDESSRVHPFKSPEFLEATMKQVNLDQVAVFAIERRLSFDSVDALLQNIKQLGATNALTNRQPGLLGTKRYREFRDVLEHRLAAAGHLESTFECIFAVAEKG